MKLENIKEFLNIDLDSPSKWELDNIVWAERTTDPKVLINFLKRIDNLHLLNSESLELKYLLELLNDLDEELCRSLLIKTDEKAKETFIENLSRHCAIEILTNSKMSYESMQTCCKLSPSDFILCAKRTQEIINSVHELVIKGENLSSSVPGA